MREEAYLARARYPCLASDRDEIHRADHCVCMGGGRDVYIVVVHTVVRRLDPDRIGDVQAPRVACSDAVGADVEAVLRTEGTVKSQCQISGRFDGGWQSVYGYGHGRVAARLMLERVPARLAKLPRGKHGRVAARLHDAAEACPEHQVHVERQALHDDVEPTEVGETCLSDLATLGSTPLFYKTLGGMPVQRQRKPIRGACKDLSYFQSGSKEVGRRIDKLLGHLHPMLAARCNVLAVAALNTVVRVDEVGVRDLLKLITYGHITVGLKGVVDNPQDMKLNESFAVGDVGDVSRSSS